MAARLDRPRLRRERRGRHAPLRMFEAIDACPAPGRRARPGPCARRRLRPRRVRGRRRRGRGRRVRLLRGAARHHARRHLALRPAPDRAGRGPPLLPDWRALRCRDRAPHRPRPRGRVATSTSAVDRVLGDLLAGGPEAVRAAKRLVRERPEGPETARIAAERRTSAEGQDGPARLPREASARMEIRKLLVANRGEIAARIFRTCDRLGIADRRRRGARRRGRLPHAGTRTRCCDVESYLDPVERCSARRSERGADAVHPGYGFLAENAELRRRGRGGRARLRRAAARRSLRAAGDKLEAKRSAARGRRAVVPSGDPAEIGFPLIIKAAAGGGGRGMRVVRDAGRARRGARGRPPRGEGRLRRRYRSSCERYVERPRHVEIQLLADAHGTIVHLGERDCSVQRRHQKVLEESPVPGARPRPARGHGRGGSRLRPRPRLRERGHGRVRRSRRTSSSSSS